MAFIPLNKAKFPPNFNPVHCYYFFWLPNSNFKM